MLRLSLLFAVGAVGVVAAVAPGCGNSNSGGSGFDDGGAGGGSGSGSGGGGSGSGSGGGGSSSGSLGGGSGSSSGGASDGCSDAARLVYVLSAENDLYSFNPPSKKFTKIGALGCSTKMTPNSMAVSRDAVAWVNYAQANPITGGDTGGAVFKVSTVDATCTPTGVTLTQDWYRLGMGFSTDSATSTSETLYVTGTSGDLLGGATSPGLGKLDLTAQSLSPIGSFSGALASQNAELTGTGDGRLYGFFTTAPVVQLAQIDKASGATSAVTPLKGVEFPTYWAFTFWGGDFYFYTAPDAPTRTTNVTHYSPGTGAIDTQYMTNIGFRIVGAGVSTCAPTVPPK